CIVISDISQAHTSVALVDSDATVTSDSSIAGQAAFDSKHLVIVDTRPEFFRALLCEVGEGGRRHANGETYLVTPLDSAPGVITFLLNDRETDWIALDGIYWDSEHVVASLQVAGEQSNQ